MTYYFKNKVRQKLVQYFGLSHNKVIVCRHKSSEKRDSNRRYSKIWLSSITFIFSLIQSLVHSCKGKKRGQMGKISASKASRVMAEEVERSTVSPPQTTSRLASLANFFVRPSRFFFFFNQCRAWSQATFRWFWGLLPLVQTERPNYSQIPFPFSFERLPHRLPRERGCSCATKTFTV